MKIRIFITFWFIVNSSVALPIFHFKNIPSAKTYDESVILYEKRREQLINYYAKKKLGQKFNLRSHREFSQPAVARAFLGFDREEVSKIILQPDFKPFGKVGTNFKAIPKICERKGDYDFALIHLIQLAFISQKNSFLTPKAYEKLIHKLLTAKGTKHHTSFTLGLCGIYKDTENHILMTETSRYLTNDLLKSYYQSKKMPEAKIYDNEINGFDDWIINHLNELKVNFSMNIIQDRTKVTQ